MRKPEPRHLIHKLNELATFEQIGFDLCDLAVRRGYLSDSQRTLLDMRDDHYRHMKSLQFLAESLGDHGQGGLNVLLARDLATSESALLEALRVNSLRAQRLYQQVLASRDLPMRLRGVLAGNLANERFYASWLARQVELAPLPPADPDRAASAAGPTL